MECFNLEEVVGQQRWSGATQRCPFWTGGGGGGGGKGKKISCCVTSHARQSTSNKTKERIVSNLPWRINQFIRAIYRSQDDSVAIVSPITYQSIGDDSGKLHSLELPAQLTGSITRESPFLLRNFGEGHGTLWVLGFANCNKPPSSLQEML